MEQLTNSDQVTNPDRLPEAQIFATLNQIMDRLDRLTEIINVQESKINGLLGREFSRGDY